MLQSNKIYKGDAFNLIKKIPDNSIDLVLTDPPYGISQKCELTKSGMKRYGRVNYGEWDKEFPINILPEFSRVCKKSFYIFTPYQSLTSLSDWAKKNQYQHRVLWWKKSNPTRRNANVYWASPGEHIFFAKRPGAYYRNTYDVGFWKHPIMHNKGHPTQKPTQIIIDMIKASTKKGDIILDPFIGSGTTAVACKLMGRKYIGFELEDKYINMATKRIKVTKNNDDLLQEKLPQKNKEIELKHKRIIRRETKNNKQHTLDEY